jgi:hypothetical protein
MLNLSNSWTFREPNIGNISLCDGVPLKQKPALTDRFPLRRMCEIRLLYHHWFSFLVSLNPGNACIVFRGGSQSRGKLFPHLGTFNPSSSKSAGILNIPKVESTLKYTKNKSLTITRVEMTSTSGHPTVIRCRKAIGSME